MQTRLNLFFALLFLITSTIGGWACSSDSSSPIATPDGDSESDTMDGDAEPDQDIPDGDAEAELEDEAETDGDAEVEAEQEEPIGVGLPPRPDVFPSLLALPEHKQAILDKLEQEPYATLLQRVEAIAAREHYDFPEPDTLDSAEQQNGETAQAAAFLAWLLDDAAMAAKARDFLSMLSDNYASHEDLDINIRLPSIVMCYTFALDLLRGNDMISEEEAKSAENKLTTIIGAFYADYVLDSVMRIYINVTQNNHPIRTACSIATVAMAFPEHPDAGTWADWAFSELDYLWGPNGQYVQADGGVSEGSLYYRFAFAPSLALFLAWENLIGEPRIFNKDCTNRNNSDPWTNHGCVDGEPFVFVNPLHEEPFPKSVDWFFSLRMPDGQRPPIEDSSRKRANGSPIMARFMNRPDLIWDWYNDEMNTGGGMNLAEHVMVWYPNEIEAAKPDWTHRVMPIAGQAVFRSGWEPQDLWMMMTAEHGSARKTIHDHVDGTSFTLSAYGEYLLIDPGYYKPNKSNNAITAQAPSHNLLMIEGEEVPEKGLLTNFGDTDAFLENEILSDSLAYVEARQPIKQSTTERAMLMLRNRYGVIFDRVVTDVSEPRIHTWRVHGYAGYDSDGVFSLTDHGAHFERSAAGVDVYLAAADPGLAIVEPPYTKDEPPHVHNYDGTGNHGVMDGVINARAPVFSAVIAPYKTGADASAAEAPLLVEALAFDPEVQGVAGWRVSTSGHTDLVIARGENAPESFTLDSGETIATDAVWCVATLNGDTPLHLIAHGSYLTINDAAIFSDISDPVAFTEGE